MGALLGGVGKECASALSLFEDRAGGIGIAKIGVADIALGEVSAVEAGRAKTG